VRRDGWREREALATTQNYIDENPVRGRLARDAEEFPFCSTFLKKKKAAGAKAGK
jgi:hypothetical protein